ncbi:MAG: RecA/RadA recombinase [uncultured Paraburkholderia sp.]|nr:MAG: RecA/RadA recombinase [uncultured Paraburkholderia sp.]CAH2811217.1 MAG: RecA/RadA recombinase [uncultured Paraburkholderia sp.]CAH2942390.1 MAG: RecA/RadA recombinase [uncultured Paraburkholderia sp.]CAH2946159.1 MAG: RecA/RadA recombinase [uncultured Paraburkholderia sp.]
MAALPKNIEDLHPSLWRGSQLGRAAGVTVDTGYSALSAQLPGGGWPRGCLVELLAQQPGIGELRLLAPALGSLGSRPVVMVKPPQTPNALGLAYVGVPLDKIMLLKPNTTADALWSAEQLLKAGTCGALLLWQQHVRGESLRRLQVAAKSGDTLLILFRPLAAASEPSPAELRLALRPTERGVLVDVVKRKGPALAEPVSVELRPSPVLLRKPRRASRPMTIVEREHSPLLVE